MTGSQLSVEDRIIYKRYKAMSDLAEALADLIGPEFAEDSIHLYALALKYSDWASVVLEEAAING